MCKEQKPETDFISEEELEDIEKIDTINTDDVFFDKNDLKDYSTEEDSDNFK